MHDFTLPEWDKPRKNDIIIRQSDIESMSLCPARYGYREDEGYDPSPSEPMAFGSLVHELIDRYIQGDDPRLLSLQQVKAVFVQIMEADGHHLYSLTNEYHVDRICMEAMSAFRSWHAEWWMPTGQTRRMIATERTRIKPLGKISKSVAVWVRGTPDFVHESGIDDWKTAGRGWDAGKAGTRIQAATYAWLEEDEIDEWSQAIGYELPFTYVIYNRAKEWWTSQTVMIDERTVDAAKNALMAYAKLIKNGVFPPTPAAPAGRPGRGWWCSAKFCGAWNVCDYKGMLPDDRDLSEVRSPKWAN